MANLKGMLTPEEQHQKDLETLEQLRLLDDTFMREAFRNNLKLAQFVLRIVISKPDLTLTKEETQYDLQHLFGSRSITLDVFGVDNDGKQYEQHHTPGAHTLNGEQVVEADPADQQAHNAPGP